jgi:hypothetical protein
MKALKLLAIFIVIVGGLFLAINWGSLFGSSPKAENFVKEDLIDISEKCDEIRNAWSSQTEWSDDLYKTQREDIDQSKFMGMFSQKGYNTVNNCLRENARNKACECYKDALHAQTFSDAALQKAYKGVTAIKKYEKMDNERRIIDVEQLHHLYTSIKSFIHSGHRVTPHFSPNAPYWTSFASAQKGILTKAKYLRENPLYKEMEHIPGFNSGLDEKELTKQTNSQKKAFYEQLSAQIIDYFNSVEPTPDKVNLLNQIYDNFTDQERKYGVDELARLMVNYGTSD